MGAFDRTLAPAAAIGAALAGLLAVLRVRMSHGMVTVTLARQGLAALATLAAASPLLLSDLFVRNTAGYIWIAGQARPCLALGGGHDVSAAIPFLFGMAFAMLGVLIGTMADREPMIPRAGIYVGLAVVAAWVLLIGSDHARFAALIGCAPGS